MDIKSILVHLDASPRAGERLAMAQRLARREGAEVTALYGVLPALLATPWAAGEALAAAAALSADLDRDLRERARATFEQALARGPVTWAEARGEILSASLLQQALVTDLLVLGQHDAGDTRTGPLPPDLVPTLIGDSGKPALVVPYAGSFDTLARQVLVAWKPSREAARAVTAALPWLRHASRIHVAAQVDPADGDDAAFGGLEHWLRRHGVAAPIERHTIALSDVGEELLSMAAESGADLLVMGCYGHSRAREWVLGGVSRSVLRGLTLPALMVH